MNRTDELIQKSQCGDQHATQILVQENTGLIWSVTKRFIGRGVETEDLYQLGCIGFLKAINGFDPAYGTKFSTYAVPKIAGEIRRFLRDDGTIKVSRGIKECATAIRAAYSQLTQELGREPTLHELVDKTGYSQEEIAVAESATSAVESIQHQSGEDGFTLESVLSDTQDEECIITRISLEQAIAQLSAKEALVIKLRYFHGLTQQRIAKVLSVSQVQVSRLEKKALQKLKEIM